MEPYNVNKVWRIDVCADGITASWVTTDFDTAIAKMEVFENMRGENTVKLYESDLLTWEPWEDEPVLVPT